MYTAPAYIEAKVDASQYEGVVFRKGIKVPGTFQVNYRFDIPSFFNFFDYLNVSKFAELAGINESKMRQYKCGSAYPGEKVTKRITSAIRKIASDFSSASL